MAGPNENNMPSYIIYRDPCKPYDPTAAPIFMPPKDSDELFDALRAKYPHLRTHSERMREAVIEFLMTERLEEQLSTPVTMDSMTASPLQASFHSVSSGSTWSSPETLGLATPNFENSPRPQVVPLSRQISTAPSVAASSEVSPPALEQMTGVFSLSDSTQPKQRMRRKMTEAEKIEYRKRRIVKACDKCAKRKRKCHHNQTEMEIVTESRSNKVTKSTTPPSSKKPPPLPNIQEQDLCFPSNSMEFVDPFGVDLMQPFDPFGPLPDDPMLDMNFEDPLALSQYQWPWSDSQDWTLMDSSFDTINSQQDLSLDPELDLVRHRQDTTSTISNLQDQNNAPSGIPWEQLRTGQSEKPRYHSTPQTAHRAWIQQISDDNSQFATSSQQGEKTSLAQMTLRLTGTAKAVRAFGGLLERRSSRTRLQKTSIKKVAMVALAGLRFSGALPTDGPLLQQSRLGLPQDMNATAAIVPSTLISHSPEGLENYVGSHSFAEISTSGPLEGMCISDYLRMEENVSNMEDSIHSTSSMHVTRSGHSDPSTTGANGESIYGLAMNPAPGNSKGMLQQQTSTSQTDGKVLSLGEGITSRVSPSAELFMLKRRIPKSLHSVVDRNNGILQTISPLGVASLHEEGAEVADNAMILNSVNAKANATQVNGGAYPRLEKDTVVHTRPNNAVSFGFIGDAVATASALQTRVATVPTPANRQPSLDLAVESINLPSDQSEAAISSQPEVYYERLSDHFRRRDHFGRPTAPTTPSFAEALEVLVKFSMLLVVLAGLASYKLAEPLPIFVLAMMTPLPSGSEGATKPSGVDLGSSAWKFMDGWLGRCKARRSGVVEDGSQNHLPARKYTPKAPWLPNPTAPVGMGHSWFGVVFGR